MKNADKLAHPEYSMYQHRDGEYVLSVEGGLTKREYFAGLAMQGMISNSTFFEQIVIKRENGAVRSIEDRTGRLAVDYADALLKALEESSNE